MAGRYRGGSLDASPRARDIRVSETAILELPLAFEELRARLDRLMAETRRFTDPREAATGLHGAMVETKVALGAIREALESTERELAAEQRQLADAERRGRMATDVGDAETVTVAERFVARHSERVTVLERKLAVQRDELMLVERDYAELSASYKSARLGIPPDPAPRVTEADLGMAPEREIDELGRRASRQEMDAAVQAQLEALKSKLGRKGG
jgi:hypothetical protein